MIDSRIATRQVQEFQLILYENYYEGIVLTKSFQVVDIIKKFLPSWKHFKNYFKYKRKETRVEDLILRLKLEK